MENRRVASVMAIGTAEIAFRANQKRKKFRSCLYLFCHVASDVAGPLKFADWEGLEKYLVVYVQQPVPGTSKTYDVQSYGHVVTGHSFIGLKDTTAHTETKAGFYPKDTVTPISPTTTGQVKDDSNHSWNVKQEYKITDDQYNAVCCLCWKWKKRSFVKIMERTYEKRAQSLHRRRESNHPEAILLRQSPSFRSV